MTYITGDTHGYPRRLKAISAYDDADAIIVCGDFGFLFDGSKEEERTLKNSTEGMSPSCSLTATTKTTTC